IALANGIGASIVYVLAFFVIPSPPELDQETEALVVNLVTSAIYLLIALVVGTVWGFRRVNPTRKWINEERAPDKEELRVALRGPLRISLVNAVLWLVGVLVFGALNFIYSPVLAATVGVTALLGGVTTCAVAYLLSERILRATTARALSYGAPSRPVLPGVRTRGMLGWALGSGVPLVGLGLVAVATVSGDEVTDDELAIVIFALGGLALTVGLYITWLTTRAVADPVLSVRRALAKVEQGELDVEVPVYDGSELGLLQAGFNRMVAGLSERERMRDLFGRHVGEDVAHAALEQDIELGGEVREVAVLFVDIVGSTKLAGERPPDEVVELLNSFFGVVVDVVDEHGGFVNKFEGDAALAIFGAPIPRDDIAGPALAAARHLAERLASEVPDLRAGIGVSGGRAVAGNVGAEKRFEYTVIGDPVNAAARLSELAKQEDCGVLASANLVEQAGSDESGHWTLGDTVALRGREAETRLATPVGA
ncbi:MAG TPA: adenylate/guanylate cyclase domain-containing protein, partial [Thermoleophilaceae bacterium]|nr:adenylate/guanylate cyclase domain-containing protein [Thermoleophilaceae bacterium]